ncbi:hypothetical protein MMC30_006112 [Trapelia coarctata]|nr:hypothetical protein [Trapelia coarctata]
MDALPITVEPTLMARTSLRMIPPIGKRKTPLTQLDTGATKSSGRNELLARKLWLLTGEIRSRKQISSHIQVLKNLIKDEEWLQFVQSAPSKDERDVSRSFHFDEVRGELVFTDYPTTAGHHNRAMANRPSVGLLPPAAMTLRSSAPAQLPVVQKIELDMSVFPPTTEHSRDSLAYHTYTRMQSEMGAQPITSDGDPFWRERCPDLAVLYDGDGQPKNSEIILLESNLELMKTFCPQRSKLGIHLYADIISDGAYKTWTHRTVFREDGQPRSEYSGRFGSMRIHNSTRVEISLFSSWWVELFQEILNRRHAIEISGDLEELQEHEDQTRENIRSRSVVQEIFASTQNESREYALTEHPAVILLWKFRQTRLGEAATTSWRKLHALPPRNAISTEPDPLDTLLTTGARAQPYTNHLELSLPSSQMPLPEPLQCGARWDQWSHVPRDPYAKPTDSMIMNVPRDLFYKNSTEGMIVDFKSDQSTHIGTSVYPEQPLFQTTARPTYSAESYNDHYSSQTAYTTQTPESYFSANHLGTLSFASHSADQQAHNFSSSDAAATILTDFASQGTTTEFSSQSTTADITSHLENTDLSPESTLDYPQETTDPSLDDFASCQIELSFQHAHLQDQSQAAYDEATLSAPVADIAQSRHQHSEPYHGEQHSHEQYFNEQQQNEQQHGQHHQRHEHHGELYSSQEPHTNNYGSTGYDLPTENGKQDYAHSFYDTQGDLDHAAAARDMMLSINAAINTQSYPTGFNIVNGDSQLHHNVEPGMTLEQFEQYKAQHQEYVASHKVNWREMFTKYPNLLPDYDGDPATHAERVDEAVARIEGIKTQIRRRATENRHVGEARGQGEILGDVEEGKEGLGEEAS